jgi:ATP/maltotriose-dependent transcriptional regulator MalT
MLDLYSAVLEALRGRFAEARAQAEGARESLAELGKRMLASQRLFAGQIELLAGDAAAAEAHFRDGYETLKASGELANLAGLSVHLAAALHAQGRDDEADELVAEAAQLGSPDDTEVQVLWRVIRSRIRAAGGSVREAEVLAGEAISIAERTDAPGIRADAQLALAGALREQGRDADARAATARALALYEAKGNLVGARETRDELAAPGPVSAR